MLKNLIGTLRDNQLHVEGYPDAVALKRIDDAIAKQLCSIALNHVDLRFCKDALGEITRLDRLAQSILAEALWTAAISRYFKCFGDNEARTQLSQEKILRNHPGAEKVFAYFKDLRDKHIIHDENPYSQSFAGVALNARDAEHKVADIISLTINAYTVDDEHLNSFGQLVEVTLAWVAAKQGELHQLVGKLCEAQSYDDLLALPDISYTAPASDKVGTTR